MMQLRDEGNANDNSSALRPMTKETTISILREIRASRIRAKGYWHNRQQTENKVSDADGNTILAAYNREIDALTSAIVHLS